jgi:hypothetical protein
LSKLNDAIEKSRAEAQKLHESIGVSTAKNHATVRVELQNAATKARELAASLREVADAQQTDSKQHLKDAAIALDVTAKSAKDIAGAADSGLKAINKTMLFNTLTAVQALSRAVAKKRSSSNLVRR